jgi:hypothetical protein
MSVTSTPTKAARSIVNGAARVPLHRLPAEVLVTIIVEVLEQADSLAPINVMSVVCRRWQDLTRHDYVWSYVAKHYLVAFPLIRQFLSPVRAAPPIAFPATTTATGRLRHRRTVSPEQPRFARPTKEAVLSSHHEVRVYLMQREHAHRVAERRRYVLHLFLSFMLFFFTNAVTAFTFALERCGGSRACILNDLHEDVWPTVGDGFNFLWATFVMFLASITANIIMQAHFEPAPLFQRVSRHLQLILHSTAVLALAVFALGLPLYRWQKYALAADPATQGSVWIIPIPSIIACVGWQVHVVFRFWSVLQRFAKRELSMTIRRCYEACANMTPCYLIITQLGACAYVDTQSQLALAVSTAIPLVTCLIVGALLLVDFFTGAKIMDGIAALSLSIASGTPLLLLCGVVRGATMLPLAIAALLFFLGHLRSLIKLMYTVDELDVLVATGLSAEHDD